MKRDEEPARKAIPLSGWKIRFDSPPRPGQSRRAAAGDVLALFRAWDGARRGPDERRQSPRYTPADTCTWIGWWKRGHFVVTPAVFVNLSLGGALLRLARRPPSSQPVWICLGTPYPVDYVQARVLEVTPPTDLDQPRTPEDVESDLSPSDDPSYESRLEFHEPCPTSFFLTVGRVEDDEAE
jgi:hypothetical protein